MTTMGQQEERFRVAALEWVAMGSEVSAFAGWAWKELKPPEKLEVAGMVDMPKLGKLVHQGYEAAGHMFWVEVLLHPTFRVPVLVFNVENHAGERCFEYESFLQDVPADLRYLISHVEHPLNPFETVFMVHPCDTSSTMQDFFETSQDLDLTYLIKWWTVVAPLIFHAPSPDAVQAALHYCIKDK